MSRTDPQFKLRLPLELKEQIEAAAEENHRSMNAEIVARLQESLVEREPHILSPEGVSKLTDEARKMVEEARQYRLEAVEHYRSTAELVKGMEKFMQDIHGKNVPEEGQ